MTDRETNRAGYLAHISRWSRPAASARTRMWLRASAVLRILLQILFVPAIVLLGLLLALYLRLSLLRRPPPPPSVIHDEALQHVSEFVEQYPFHLYPVVAKALELAYLKRRLANGGLIASDASIVEVAIGEGTLSARVFGSAPRVTGLDLNPHSLSFAAKLPHVRRAIVCDGIQPPIRPASFDLLLAVNFLHHVTDKRGAVQSWASIARTIVFNENTRYWASGWTIPYVLRRLGLEALATRAGRAIEVQSLQDLKHRADLERELHGACDIEEEVSFFSERCFFYSSLFSFLMRCYGPPTPAVLKGLFNGPLRGIAIPLTTELAKRLLELDQYQDRATDTFVFFACRGTPVGSASDGEAALCPRCRSVLEGNRCASCGITHPVADGMLFLLPPQWAHLFEDYVSTPVAPVPAQHL